MDPIAGGEGDVRRSKTVGAKAAQKGLGLGALTVVRSTSKPVHARRIVRLPWSQIQLDPTSRLSAADPSPY